MHQTHEWVTQSTLLHYNTSHPGSDYCIQHEYLVLESVMTSCQTETVCPYRCLSRRITWWCTTLQYIPHQCDCGDKVFCRQWASSLHVSWSRLNLKSCLYPNERVCDQFQMPTHKYDVSVSLGAGRVVGKVSCYFWFVLTFTALPTKYLVIPPKSSTMLGAKYLVIPPKYSTSLRSKVFSYFLLNLAQLLGATYLVIPPKSSTTLNRHIWVKFVPKSAAKFASVNLSFFNLCIVMSHDSFWQCDKKMELFALCSVHMLFVGWVRCELWTWRNSWRTSSKWFSSLSSCVVGNRIV